ncbi:MAG: radical SAM protein [Candidatus Heimdallarchaeum aukensis]|uniref:Radical SAM protein n=1 Tax=Candidatus Heimdallarchaeum aukensis TaxID=2876573 RepID=A0A9Y1BPV7_9ARCH|nr:MAG: radical SAM protein [Candidatus Heimdallarchaeum aukensis]
MNAELLHEAEYYHVVDEEQQIVKCDLCPFGCELAHKEKGKCKARMNISGKLYSLTYGFTKMQIDRIEKQHVLHFFPSARAQTFMTYNCNLDCSFCPVSELSQIEPETISGKKYPPQQAAMFGLASGSRVMVFGDSEPLVSFEWVRDTAKIAKEKKMKILLRTNGYFNEEPFKEILQYVDAVAIEVKGLNDEDYLKNCGGGDFEHIKKIMKLIYEHGTHLEVSLVIHEKILNDDISAGALAHFLATEISPDIPLHLVRLKPAYKVKDLQPTSKELMEEAFKMAKEAGINFCYIHGIPDHPEDNTTCPKCGQLLIKRTSTSTEVLRISLDGRCNNCQTEIYIVMK